MCKARLALILSFLYPVLSAAPPPVNRLERERLSNSSFDPSTANADQREDPSASATEGGTSDMGEQIILERKTKLAPVNYRANTFLFWSDNVSSAASDEEEGWFYGGSLTASWRQPLQDKLFLEASAYQDAYFYDSPGLNFESSEFGAGLIATVPFIESLTVYGRYEFLYVHADNPLYETDSTEDEHLGSHYHRLHVGASKLLYSNPGHRLSFSTTARWDFDTNTGTERRLQLSGRLVHTWAATDRFLVSSYYGLSNLDYLTSDQNDWNHYLGLGLTYKLNDWAQLSCSFLYGINDSDNAESDYESLQGGLGLSFNASF